jgi:phosphoglycolate phosphatase
MVGDSITDLKAGHAADMPVVLVDYGYTDDASIYDHADMVINDFEQMKTLLNS